MDEALSCLGVEKAIHRSDTLRIYGDEATVSIAHPFHTIRDADEGAYTDSVPIVPGRDLLQSAEAVSESHRQTIHSGVIGINNPAMVFGKHITLQARGL